MIETIAGIIGIIAGVKSLFDIGVAKAENISGMTFNNVKNSDQLESIIKISLTDEQQKEWAESLKNEINKYIADTDRIVNQEKTDPILLNKTESKSASKISLLRQTTRPWAVRKLVHWALFPFYVGLVDLLQLFIIHYINQFRATTFEPLMMIKYLFGNYDLTSISGVVNSVVSPQTSLGTIYTASMPWVTAVIISYFGMRQYEKNKQMYLSNNYEAPSLLDKTIQTASKIKTILK